MTTAAITIESGGHVVHFYEDDTDLITTLGGYVAAAIMAGDATLIIATGDHREALDAHLGAEGLDVSGAHRNGLLVAIDAADTLAGFFADGRIDAEQFHAVISGTIRDLARRTGRPVRCHGEMVALLWDAGDVTAALELEGLWNDLSAEQSFALLCSYPSQSVAGPEHSFARRSIRHQHSDVLDSRPGAERKFLGRQPRAGRGPEDLAPLTELSRLNLAEEVHQASGMVAVQLGVDPAQALDRLRTFAAEQGRTLDQVAVEVLGRRLRFGDPAGGSQ